MRPSPTSVARLLRRADRKIKVSKKAGILTSRTTSGCRRSPSQLLDVCQSVRLCLGFSGMIYLQNRQRAALHRKIAIVCPPQTRNPLFAQTSCYRLSTSATQEVKQTQSFRCCRFQKWPVTYLRPRRYAWPHQVESRTSDTSRVSPRVLRDVLSQKGSA
jgi:hypothetical protein